jgi:hypothetical protein
VVAWASSQGFEEQRRVTPPATPPGIVQGRGRRRERDDPTDGRFRRDGTDIQPLRQAGRAVSGRQRTDLPDCQNRSQRHDTDRQRPHPRTG